MEVLTTPLGGVLACVTTCRYQRLSGDLMDWNMNLLKDGKVTLSTYTTVVVDETVRIFHRSPTSLVLVLADTYSECALV